MKLNIFGNKLPLLLSLGAVAFATAMCGFSNNENGSNPTSRYGDSTLLSSVITTQKQKFRMETIETGIAIPWGMEFMPNGDVLITERAGKIKILRNNKILEEEITGVPAVYARGQGGLFDLELHPNYANNGWIYISYAALDQEKNEGGITYIMRAKIKNNQLTDQQILFKGAPFTRSGAHFGGRLEFDKQGFLYFSIGERGDKEKAQSLELINGKVYRIKDDGTIPTDNPFYNTPNAIKAIWSYGHRNPQGLAMHPETGAIWETEHGPKGGDELNIIKKGANYGWPKISFGINYDGTVLTKDTLLPGMELPQFYWVPSIGISNLIFVKGDKYPGWKGNIIVSGMALQVLERLELQGDKVLGREKLIENMGRIRNVEQSPEGIIYVAFEGGKLIKLIPES